MARPRKLSKSHSRRNSRAKRRNSSITSTTSDPRRYSKSTLRPAGILARLRSYKGDNETESALQTSSPISSPASSQDGDGDSQLTQIEQTEDETKELNWTTSSAFTAPVDDPIAILRQGKPGKSEVRNLPEPTTFIQLRHSRVPRHIKASPTWYCKMSGCEYSQTEADTIAGQEAITQHYHGHAESNTEALELVGQLAHLSGGKIQALLEKLHGEAEAWTAAMENDTRLLNPGLA